MEKKPTKPRKNVNEYTKHEPLTLNDVESPMMENFKHTYVSEIDME
jgi:hypothetical protein